MRSNKYHLNRILLYLEYLYGVDSPKCIPTEIYFEPTTLCNLACPACPTGNSLQIIREKATLKAYEEIFESYSQYLDKWYLYNWGEPLLHKDLAKILDILGKGSFSIYMSSNFSVRANEETLRAIASTKNLNIRIDIDGIAQETHEKYRSKSNLSLIKENCKELSSIMYRIQKDQRANIWIGSLKFSHNKGELKDIEEFARSLGFSHKVYDEPLTKGEPPVNENSNITYQQGFGCTWLYSTLTLSSSATSFAPCCGTWHPSYFQKINDGNENMQNEWANNKIMSARRSESHNKRQLNKKLFTEWQVKNAKQEDSMGLNQGKYIGDICSNCTMGNAYQKDLSLIRLNADKSANHIFNELTFSKYKKMTRISLENDQNFMRIKEELIKSTKDISHNPTKRNIDEFNEFINFLNKGIIS